MEPRLRMKDPWIKYSKQIKELQSRIDELDEEIIIERNNRARLRRTGLCCPVDLEDLGSRLSEAGSNTSHPD